jgi:branched-chain amino acid aminotransferase
MGILVNLNGELVPPEQARLSVFDRGFLYGDSVYETLRSYGGRVFLLCTHLDRLMASAAAIGLHIPWRLERMSSELTRTVEAAGNREAAVRVMVTRGESAITLVPETDSQPNVIIVARPHEELAPGMAERGVEAAVVSVIRNAPQALDPNIKSGNFLNNILAAREAAKRGAYEGLMLTRDGFVTEGTTSNVFVVKDDCLATPDDRIGLLRGITRRLVLRLAADLGRKLEVRHLPERELREADEIFITSTLKEVLPVTRLDGVVVGDGRVGPVTREMSAAYRDAVRRFIDSGVDPLQ